MPEINPSDLEPGDRVRIRHGDETGLKMTVVSVDEEHECMMVRTPSGRLQGAAFYGVRKVY